jgi:hypothetical protein
MIISPSNIECTNALMNSRRGSGTPPWLHHAGPTMVAREWPKPSPRQLEDLRRLPSCRWLSDERMRRPFGVEDIYELRSILVKGEAEPPRKRARPVLTLNFRQPSHEFTFGVGLNYISYSLVLTPLV